MLPIENRTTFPAEVLSLLDKAGLEVRVLVMTATFEWQGSPELPLAPVQEPVCFADEHRGDPACTSVLREADACMPKPFVDVVVDGCAYPPAGQAATEVAVGLLVGDIRKQLRIMGDRPGKKAGDGGSDSPVVPFRKMPVIYERAFGGGAGRQGDPAKAAIHAANPIGLGFKGATALDPAIMTESPNVEHHPSAPAVAREAAAGFGIVGRGWSPRLRWAGTYDATWLEEQWPLPPLDFDDRHYQCAPLDQQSSTLRGGEVVRLVNMTPEGLWEFRLPQLRVPVWLIGDDGPERLQFRLDTVLIRPEQRCVVMCQRAVIRRHAGGDEAREVVMGDMSNAWLRARCGRRAFLDFGGTRGEVRHAVYFQ